MRIIDMPEFRDKNQVLSFEVGTKLGDVINAMAERNYGAALVTENEKLVGIFTERDLLRRVVPKGLDIHNTNVEEVMSTHLKTAKTTDMVSDCMRRMSQGRFRHMPVVGDQGGVCGMLSQGDFVALTMSDIVKRVSSSAQAEVGMGQNSPVVIIGAIAVYTLALLFILSAFGF